MDDADTQEMIDEAIAQGLVNLNVLSLGAAWCKNINVTRGPMGVGELELATGLPISGGSLRCDYAAAPTSFGMALERTAVDFYAKNCVGCAHRVPTEATEHLGTWADSVLADHEAEQRRLEAAHLQAEQARLARARARRALLGAPNATLQSILDLVDRVDSVESDREAERLLLAHAEMSPGDFPDALLQHFVDEALAIGNSTLFGAAVAIFEREGRPAIEEMVATAFAALEDGVGREAAGRVVASHATAFDVSAAAHRGIIGLAAGHVDHFGADDRVGGEPAALLRFYDTEPVRAIEALSTGLAAGDPWPRSTVAHAVEKLVAARPAAGPQLLTPLLESLRLVDKSKYLGDPFAAGTTVDVVAEILIADPEHTAKEIDARLGFADARYAKKLWRCFDSAARGRLRAEIPAAVGEAICVRAIDLLGRDLDVDLLDEIADTLELVARYHGDTVPTSLDELISLVCVWGDRVDAHERSPHPSGDEPATQEHWVAWMEWQSGRVRLESVLRTLGDVIKLRAERAPRDYVVRLEQSWEALEQHRAGRAILVEGLETVRTTDDLELAQPLLVRILSAERVGERAAGLRALEAIGRHGVQLTQPLAERVLADLGHDKLYVVLGAIRALWQVQVPTATKPVTTLFLVQFAAAYAEDVARADDVRSALQLAGALAEGEAHEEVTQGLILDVVMKLPHREAADLLDRWVAIRDHAKWPLAATHALRHDDGGYRGLRARERARILADLANLSTGRIAPTFDALEQIALERAVVGDCIQAWAIADVVARHGDHDRAARIAAAVVDELPDTPEMAPRRLFARLVALGHQMNAAAAAGDDASLDALLVEASLLSGKVDDD